ncbi:DNA polymerase epsilon subunit 4 isoform X1 [Rhincodon typus]|uniref:DNA polymerase epsilon subunit 4 isoform X1 n=2 Tax=Orectolobiformes TaxID=30503 RepID=UPI00203052E1|nr:DNA polymerase epsilon subunit 4 isoform X1 [Rhincodon typus]
MKCLSIPLFSIAYCSLLLCQLHMVESERVSISGGVAGRRLMEERESGVEPGQSLQLEAEVDRLGLQHKLLRLPLSRIKGLMKADPDVSLASQEAVFAIGKATELFVEVIAKDAYSFALRGKRKTIQRKDVDNAVDVTDEFAFLEGTLD